jgi:hypothetical protein
VVYYAGHGYEDNGENFLLPVDSDLKYNREHSLRTQEILEAMQQCDTSLNLLIIDACRVRLVYLGVVHIDRGGGGGGYSLGPQENIEHFL